MPLPFGGWRDAISGKEPTMQSVDDRKIDRADVISKARHNVMLEGLQVSREFSEASDEYVAGRISASELLRQTRARFGIA